tara:strand:- start:1093 stop:1407 length:315 start_codon:yes stop_codon:yes gene_type:complete
MKKILLLLLLFSFSTSAVPPPRGIDPVEAKRQERKAKAEREKARKDSINCYITERKKRSDGGFNCIYRCPLKFNPKTRKREYRVENNNVGPGFGCPSVMNVLRR